MKRRSIRRAVVIVSMATLAASVPAAAPAQQLGGTPTSLSVDAVASSLVAGEVATFVWTYADPDAFTVFRLASIDHGDRSQTQIPSGLLFPPCGELLHAQGVEDGFQTHHGYDAAGTYEVTATLTTRQQVCGEPLSEDETTEVRLTVEVRPAT